jgi:hypothetical protein
MYLSGMGQGKQGNGQADCPLTLHVVRVRVCVRSVRA